MALELDKSAELYDTSWWWFFMVSGFSRPITGRNQIITEDNNPIITEDGNDVIMER